MIFGGADIGLGSVQHLYLCNTIPSSSNFRVNRILVGNSLFNSFGRGFSRDGTQKVVCREGGYRGD
jgi:hypothetical protein